jgi:hypothetical protein
MINFLTLITVLCLTITINSEEQLPKDMHETTKQFGYVLSEIDGSFGDPFVFKDSNWQIKINMIEDMEDGSCEPEFVYTSEEDLSLVFQGSDSKEKIVSKGDYYLILQQGENVFKHSSWVGTPLSAKTCELLKDRSSINVDQFLSAWKQDKNYTEKNHVCIDALKYPFENGSFQSIQEIFGESKNDFIDQMQEELKDIRIGEDTLEQDFQEYNEQVLKDFEDSKTALEQDVVKFCEKYEYSGGKIT